MSRCPSVLLALCAALPFSALTGCATTSEPRATRKPGVYQGASTEYPNGLRLLVHEAASASQASLLVSYRVGALDDPPGKEGLAFLAAELTQVALDGGPSLRALKQRESTGVDLHRDYETTDFMVSAPVEQLSQLMEQEARRMREPLANLSEADFIEVRNELVEELRQPRKTHPRLLVLKTLQRRILPGHPYGQPLQGTSESIGRLTLDDVRAFVKQHYTPEAAVVTVAGSRPLEEVGAEVERLFPGLKDTERTERLPPLQSPPPPPFPETLPTKDEEPQVIPGPVRTPMLWLVWMVPGYSSGKDTERALAEVLLYIALRSQVVGTQQARDIQVSGYHQDGMSLIIAELPLDKREDTETALHWASSAINALAQPYNVRQLSPLIKASARALLVRDAEQFPVLEATRVWRATGRADYLNLRKQQLASFSSQEFSDYLRTYLRFEQARVLLVVKPE
jgi:zinc protease